MSISAGPPILAPRVPAQARSALAEPVRLTSTFTAERSPISTHPRGSVAHGDISVDEDRCKGCGLCVPVCPKHLIELANRFTPRGYHPAGLIAFADGTPHEQCTGCMLCSTICPDAAITVYRLVPTRA